MQIDNIPSFLFYYARIRERTLKVIECIPPDKLEWTYRQGKFTLGDLVRHIAATERYMYAQCAMGKASTYHGCGKDLANGYDATLHFFNKLHNQSVEIFSSLTVADLNKHCIVPGGHPITVSKWLRAMVEHEIHHRAQIFTYLGLLDVPVYPLFGLTAEEVQSYSNKAI